MEHSILELYYFLYKLLNYEEALYYKIKLLVCYKFKSNKELKEVVDLYTTQESFENVFNKYGHISLWDTSLITDTSKLFARCLNFNENINNWDVSNVTNMKCMFSGCENFNQSLNSWDVSNVENMEYMFDECPISEEYKPQFR